MSQFDFKPVLLVVSFGTSYLESRELTIGAVETALQTAYPDYQVRRAFTSQVILDILKQRDGLEIDNVRQALERLVHDGVRLRAIAVDKTRARLPAAFLQGLPEFPQGTESPVSFSVCHGDIVRKNRVNVPLRLTLIKVILPLVYGVILGPHPLTGQRILT